jgi:pimeloyl-ACP methyl ester carboxylesterase
MIYLGILLLVLVGIPLLLHIFAQLFVGKTLKQDISQYLRSSEQLEFSPKGRAQNWLVFKPRQREVRAGLLFHPGGYVDPESYARIISAVAEQGIFCVILCNRHRTPIADRFAADRVMAAYPDIKQWFIGGHSQGGAVSTLYTRDRPDEKRQIGLIYLGCYVLDRHSLSDRALPTLNIWGSNDGHADKFEPNEKNLPQPAHCIKIEGGNHRQFAHYGLHFGDGEATISREEQQTLAIAAISEFINKVLPQA